MVQRTGSPCTALAFTLRRRTEFLVAMSDYSLKCFDTGKFASSSVFKLRYAEFKLDFSKFQGFQFLPKDGFFRVSCVWKK